MITAKDIFTDKQYDYTFGTDDMIPRPIVTKTESQLLSIDEDGGLQIMLANGEMKTDLYLPTETHLYDVVSSIKRIIAAGEKECFVTVQKWGDKE